MDWKKTQARRLQSSLVVAFGILLATPQAHPAPLTSSRVGGLILSSPTAPHESAIYWNPAALGLLYGHHIFLDGTLRMTTTTVHRDPIDPTTGEPSTGPGSVDFPRVQELFLAPDTFGAITSDLGSDSVVIGVAVYTPIGEMEDFGGSTIPGQNAPLRYHRVRTDWYSLFVTPVVAVRFHKKFYAGIGLSYVRSMLHMSFYRDRTIRQVYRPTADSYRVEDPQHSELVVLDAADNSFAVNGGILINIPGGYHIGVTYRSRPLGLDRTNIEASGDVRITRWDEATGWYTLKGRGKLFYDLPDSVAVGFRWEPTKKWAADFMVEWLDFHLHDKLRFQFSGNELRAAGLGNLDVNFARYRGFRDVWRVQLGGEYQVLPTLRVGGALMYESAALDTKWVNPAAIDGHKADLLAFVEYRPHPAVTISLGYSFQGMLPAHVDSGFHPELATQCVENKVDLIWSEACAQMADGKAIPTASGDYSRLIHKLGISISVRYPYRRPPE